MDYAVFISYRHVEPDRGWARWLHGALETYRIPARLLAQGRPPRIGRVFRDEEELAASADLSARIAEALTAARALIVICSPRTPGSRWVSEEINRFRALGREARLLALLVEGEPSEAFPAALGGVEPLAADVRDQARLGARETKRTALLKLIASLLEVPYDELRRRDDERARKRLAWIASSALAATAVFATVSAVAIWQWQRAEHELAVSRSRSLAALSQVALAADNSGRAALLGLESLNAFPTVEGDAALRAALWKLDSVGERDSHRWMDLPAAGGDTLGESADGALRLVRSTEGLGDWVFASAELVRARDNRRLALLPHEWQLRNAVFSEDGRWLLTVTGMASADAEDPSATALVGSTVRIWDATSLELHTQVSLADRGGFSAVGLSADARWLATTAYDGETLAWPLWPDELRGSACRRLTRNLSSSEWLTFLPGIAWSETCPGLPQVSE